MSVESNLVSRAKNMSYLLIRSTNSGYKDLLFRPHTFKVPINSCFPYAFVVALSRLLISVVLLWRCLSFLLFAPLAGPYGCWLGASWLWFISLSRFLERVSLEERTSCFARFCRTLDSWVFWLSVLRSSFLSFCDVLVSF